MLHLHLTIEMEEKMSNKGVFRPDVGIVQEFI